MGLHVLKDATTFVGSHDLTAESNEVRLAMDVAEKECTTFGSGGSREYKPGLRSANLDIRGFWQAGAGTVDPAAFTNLGVADQVATWCQLGTAGSVAYFGRFTSLAYQLGGQIGEMMPFSLTAKGSQGQGVVRGLLAKAKGSVSATGVTGSVVEVGAALSSQYLYAVVHVFSAGTTITIDLESDNAAGFPSAAVQATIGPLTTAGGTWMTRIAGPITDTHYRFNVTACTGTFSIAAAVGVQ